MRAKLAVLPTLVFALLTSPSHAGPAEDHAAAVDAFNRGKALVEAGKLAPAMDQFREALRREPTSLGARLNLADCYDQLGDAASAWHEYTVAELVARKGNDPRRALAESSAFQLEPRLLKLTITVPLLLGLHLRVNGAPVDAEIVALGVLAVAPGRYALEASAPGKAPAEVEVSGAAGETRAVNLVLRDLPPAPAASPEEVRRDPGAPYRTGALVAGAVGVAGVALGVVAGLVASNKKSSLTAESTDPTVGAARFDDDLSTARAYATASTVGFVVAGVGLAGVVTLLIAGPSRVDGASGAAWLGAGAGGASLAGRF